MLKRFIFCILAAVPSLAAYAGGSGTIQETDSAIYVEYYGNEEDAKAARIASEREDKQAEIDADRQIRRVAKSKEHTVAKQAARMAEVAARGNGNSGEVRSGDED